MAHNHRRIHHALLNLVRDLEAPLTLRLKVHMQHQEIIHVLDQDQILQSQIIFHLNVYLQRQIFSLLNLLRRGQFLNRDLVRDLFLDPVLALQKHRYIHAPDRELPSLSNQDPDQDQDQNR